MNIAVITCYDQQDYVRAKSLRAAFAHAPGTDVRVIRNSYKGLLRYLEVPLKILKLRLSGWPDVYVIAFRGYEMLPWTLLVKGRKPLVFDEFVNAAEYLQEHNTLQQKSRLGRLFIWWYSGLLRRCRFILADTQVHAAYSGRLTGVSLQKYVPLPVNADEQLCHPYPDIKRVAKPFTVFYYGNGMTPLHGLQYVLDAAVQLKDNADIRFNLIGGGKKAEQACRAAAAKGADITYKSWVPFDELFRRAAAAGLCLGGPFGKTLQSQFVVTGKTIQFLACAAPVLVGKNKASDVFVDRDNCLLVPPANAQAIAMAITWASRHPKELDTIGKSGQKLYKSEFAQLITNERITQLVKDLANDRPV